MSSQILSCRTAEHLCALQRELGDWISDCGFPGIYGPNICIQDVPKIYSYVVRHYIYLRYDICKALINVVLQDSTLFTFSSIHFLSFANEMF